eukprot:s258_g23.t1
MSLAATDHQRPSEGAGGEQENSGKARPFSEYVCFETEGGLALLYEPVPLDRWIGRKIYHDWRTRKYFDRTTGDELTEEDTKDYKRYEELRIYVGKHPWKIAQLLAKAKKVFNTAVMKDAKKGKNKKSKAKKDEKHKKKEQEKDRATLIAGCNILVVVASMAFLALRCAMLFGLLQVAGTLLAPAPNGAAGVQRPLLEGGFSSGNEGSSAF